MGNSGNKNGGWGEANHYRKQQDYLCYLKELPEKEGNVLICWMFCQTNESLLGLWSEAERLSPYKAKVECLTWFQVSRGRLCGAEGGTVKAWADKLNNVFQWFWLKERQSGLLLTFQNSCKFADAHGALPRADTSSPQFSLVRTTPFTLQEENHFLQS